MHQAGAITSLKKLIRLDHHQIEASLTMSNYLNCVVIEGDHLQDCRSSPEKRVNVPVIPVTTIYISVDGQET